MAGPAGEVGQHRQREVAVVRAPVPEHQQRRPRADRVGVLLGEAGERPAVVGASPQRGLRDARRQRLHHLDHVGARTERVAHLDHVVDEGEGAHAAEGLAQGVHQHQGELREVGHRAAHVAEHDEVGAVRATRTVVGGQRHPARGDRRAHRAAYVEGAAPLRVLLLGQPGGEPARQRVDLAAHLLEVAAPRGGEVEAVDGRPHGHVDDVLGPLLLGDASAGVALDQPGEVADAATGRPLRPLVVEAGGQQPLHEPVHQLGGRDPLEGGVRRPARQTRALDRASRRSVPPPRLQGPATPAGRRRPAPPPAPRGTCASSGPVSGGPSGAGSACSPATPPPMRRG